MSARTVFIYCLVSSRDQFEKVWYVGQSVDALGRFKRHSGYRNKISNWIRRERLAKHEVEVRILAECANQACANRQETKWINAFRTMNPNLLNTSNGGKRARLEYLDEVRKQERKALRQHRSWLKNQRELIAAKKSPR